MHEGACLEVLYHSSCDGKVGKTKVMLKSCWICEALHDFVTVLLSTGLSSPVGPLLFCCLPFSFLVFKQRAPYLSYPLAFLNSLCSGHSHSWRRGLCLRNCFKQMRQKFPRLNTAFAPVLIMRTGRWRIVWPVWSYLPGVTWGQFLFFSDFKFSLLSLICIWYLTFKRNTSLVRSQAVIAAG